MRTDFGIVGLAVVQEFGVTDWALMTETATAAFATVAIDVQEPVRLEVLEGAIPDGLQGEWLRNGPGRSSRGGVAYGHPFDGDGYVQRLVFRDGRASFQGRFVATPEFLAEESANRILYRGFGTNKPGGLWSNFLRMRFKNAANTSIVQIAGHLLALWEGGLPTKLDPNSLDYVERFDFNGALRNRGVESWVSPEIPFSAHPSLCERTGELWNFGTAYGRQNRLIVHRVTPDGVLTSRSIVMKSLPFVHDFVLTERFAVFFLPSVAFDVPKTLLGLSTPVESLSMDGKPGVALLVPRDGGPVERVEIPPGFVFHWGAGWEEGDTLVLDGLVYDGFPDFVDLEEMMGPEGAPGLLARPERFRLNRADRSVTVESLAPYFMELPAQHGRGASRVLYGTAAPNDRRQPFLSGVLRLGPDEDVVFRDLYPHLPGEPMVASKWLLVQVFCAPNTSEVWILDSATLKTVTRLALPIPLPPALHGFWSPA